MDDYGVEKNNCSDEEYYALHLSNNRDFKYINEYISYIKN